MVNFSCISLHASRSALCSVVHHSLTQVFGDHPRQSGDRRNATVQICRCLAILLTPILWDGLGKGISAGLRSTAKGENKLAGISFEPFLSDLL